VLTGKRDAIRTLVAAFAVPFPPIPTFVAHFTMPRAAILDDLSPAERIPIRLAALLAGVILEELPQRD
jgi:hypothetical protein